MEILPSILKRDDIRGIYPTELNGAVAIALGHALVDHLRQKCGQKKAPKVAIGYDCRHGSEELMRGLAEGISSAGGQIVILGQCSTEHLYYFCGEHQPVPEAGVMITASHNPKEYNGMKFLYGGALPFTPDDLKNIFSLAQQLPSCASVKNLPEAMANFAMEKVFGKAAESFNAEMKVVVLAGHGMGGVAFRPVASHLASLGVETIFVEEEPNGDFPQGVPNPLKPEWTARLGKLVQQYQADLGILFDGDADRAGFVDGTGAELTPSQTLALIAEEKLSGFRGEFRPVICRNLCVSQRLVHLFPPEGKVELVDTPVGHGRIKQLMRSDALKGRVLFAGEHSGHFFYPEFHSVDSGLMTALYMLKLTLSLKAQNSSLSQRLFFWKENYCWSGELNFELSNQEAVRQAIDAVAGLFPEENRQFVSGTTDLKFVFVTSPCEDVFHVGEGSWFVLRPSGNEPKLRLNVESWGPDAQNRCSQLVNHITSQLKTKGEK